MSDIENFDIRGSITDSIIDVFETMVSMEVELSDSEPPDISGTKRMLAAVNFAGSVAGIFNIQVTSELACLMTANMLDMEPEEVEDDAETKDLLAEISNIVGGNLKSALSDGGHPCVLSTPSIICGADFTTKSLEMERFERFAFKHQQHYILAEVGLKTQQASGDGDAIGTTDAQGQLGNIDAEKINKLDLNARVSESVIDVFDTMLSTKLEIADSVTDENIEGVRNVGTVSFAGDATGMVSIHVAHDFLRQITAVMLEKEVEEIEGDDETGDTLGEIGNIIGGNLKSAFSDAGLTCALSTPSFTTGTDFKIEALNMEKYERFAFRCDENVIFVEMGTKISEPVQADSQQGKDIHSPAGDDVTQEEANQTQQEVKGEEKAVETDSIPDAAEQPQTSLESDASQADKPEPSEIAAESIESEVKTPQLPKTSTPSHEGKKQGSPAKPASKTPEDVDLDLLLDIPLEIKVELGRAKIPIHTLLKFGPGSAVKLLKLEGEPVDILANETLIARGEVVVQNQKYGIRVIEITSRMDRIRGFGI
ncbi:MAG: flagellar motor switch protein FliN [Desulfobacterales bacterium]|nr:flagellar motor switch protein FliN [Desulfobacterales bacterium]